jgi:uncharacterized surface protein with fasciclin (FAS1) repeats
MFKIKKYNSTVLLSALLTLGLVGCDDDDDDDDPAPQLDIVETAVADGRFTTLVSAVTAADLVATLQSDGPFTVFAPTDDAFNSFIDGSEAFADADALLAAEGLGDILTYHVLGSKVDAATATSLAGETTATVNGANVGISVIGTDLYINNAKVVVADVNASNGVIHALDRVLNVTVVSDNTLACGIDGALPTMVEIASNDARFSTLVTAVGEAADAVGTTLSSAGALTLFAPTNDAFAKVDATALTNLLADEAALTNVLLNHVYASGAVDSATAYSLNGVTVDAAGDGDLSILLDADSRSLSVEGSTIIVTDIPACNGIIHAIDTVIL